jgi:hypothetical protein
MIQAPRVAEKGSFKAQKPQAVFLVVYDPSMNEL